MKEKSLKNTRPELALEWSERNMELTPDDVTYGSNRKVWWKGLCGHEWEATVKSRAVGRNGCPYCANAKVLPEFNDLASQQPDLASEWSEKNENLGADMVTQYSSRKVWWVGRCGHEWQARVSDRTKGHGCPYCKDHKVLPGFNDLKSL